MLGENLSVNDFLHKLNQVVSAAATNTSQTENSEQPGPSSVSVDSPKTPVSMGKRSRQVSISSPSKRCKHLKDNLDEDIERHKKGDEISC